MKIDIDVITTVLAVVIDLLIGYLVLALFSWNIVWITESSWIYWVLRGIYAPYILFIFSKIPDIHKIK